MIEEATTAEAEVQALNACENNPQAPASGVVNTPCSVIASVLEYADKADGRRERILDLFCRFRVPASGLALPFFAKNLLVSVRLVVADGSADEDHLRQILADIEWLSKSEEVAGYCSTPKLREGNPTFGRCATSTPHYAAICQIIDPANEPDPDPERIKALAILQAHLFLLLTGAPIGPEQVSAYEESVLLGKSLQPLSESACAAFRGIRYLAKPIREAVDILTHVPRGLTTSDFVAELRNVSVSEAPEAIRRFRELREHFEFLLKHAPRLREQRDTQKPPVVKKSSGSGSHDSEKRARRLIVFTSEL